MKFDEVMAKRKLEEGKKLRRLLLIFGSIFISLVALITILGVAYHGFLNP